jgi:Gas vesicle synthesis protein GvpL/GvpF
VRDRPEATPPDAAGVDGEHSVRLIADGTLAAIVSDVPLSEFGEEPLVENLNDVAWLEEAARGHELVLERALREATVVPMRLCTIYNDEDGVREMLERERPVLVEALERLAHKREWGVKMVASHEALDDALETGGAAAASSASPGAAYIEERRREARARADLEELAESWANEIHDQLAGRAAEALRNPLQPPELADYEGEMLLNGVYLVDDDRESAFRDAVTTLAAEWSERGVAVELTGPWPPYNFVKSSIEAAR